MWFCRKVCDFSRSGYVAYPISYRQLEEMMQERGVEVDHSSLNRWVIKYTPALDKAFRQRKRSVGTSWRLDETYIRVKGHWKYLYQAVDKAGPSVDFLLTAKRDRNAALRFLRKAIDQSGLPEKITLDKSGDNTAAIDDYNTDHETGIELRVAGLGPQAKYLNNIVEQDHRAIKRQTRPMLGFKSFWSVAVTVAGIELMHMIRKGQLEGQWNITSGATNLFVSYVEKFKSNDRPRPLGNFATVPTYSRNALTVYFPYSLTAYVADCVLTIRRLSDSLMIAQ